MKRPLELTLDQRLSRITWVTVLPVISVFLAAISFVLYDQQKKDILIEEAFLTQFVEVQAKAVEQEIFLNLEEALKMRLDTIVENDRLKAAKLRACIRLAPLKNAGTSHITSCSKPSDLGEFDKNVGTFRERVISIGVEPIAKIQYFLVKDLSWKDFLPPWMLLSILFAIIGAIFLHRHAVRNLQRNVVAPLLKEIAQDERSAAIAQTMQMVAHDVRKPFLALKMSVETLHSTKNQHDFEDLKAKIVPDLDRSISTVDSMLADVLELGATRDIDFPDASFTDPVGQVLQTLVPLYPHLQVTFTTMLAHGKKVRVDSKHILRIVYNLIENAIQAVNEGGKIWVETRLVTVSKKQWVECTVGNTGSSIGSDDLEKIFRPFVTTKKTGYGLGLAIATKFVTDYGGRIWATSSPVLGTEFTFRLPAGTQTDTQTALELGSQKKTKSTEAVTPTRLNESESQSAHVLLFDDEESVRKQWSLGATHKGISSLKSFSSWEDFVSQDAFDLVANSIAFVDIHFRGSRYNGLDIAKHLRRLGVRRLYAVTSDLKTAADSGLFDEVLGKEFPDQAANGS